MIVDFERRETANSFDTDVCLVGAGAAGIALALQLAAAGLSVALLESGGATPLPADQTLNRGISDLGATFHGLEEGRVRALGGATNLWYGQCIRLEDIDFATRPWVRGSGWPIGLRDLESYYRQAEAFFGITGLPYDGAAYARFGLPAPPFDPAYCSTHFTIYSPHVDLGSIHRQSLHAQPEVDVVLHATAVEITTDAAGSRATGVRIRTLGGREGIVRAQRVVLCGGGIENPRLLLASASAKPAGLGNEHDLVGRFFQDHPNAETATLTTDDPARAVERFSLLYEKSLRFFPKLALGAEQQTAERVLNCNGHFVFEYREGSGISAGKEIYRALRRGKLPPEFFRHVRDLVRNFPETVAAAKRFFIDRKSPVGTPARIRFQCYLEQEPNRDSRVQLADSVDALGMREAHIAWMFGETERRTLRVMTAAVAHEVARLGFGSLAPDAWLEDPNADWRSRLGDAFHHIGTTRMGANASEGVVDLHCAVYGVENLYIAGSSVFPTSGYANPTLTIVALALRLGERLIATSARQ